MINVGINGFGRIGRGVTRKILRDRQEDMRFVAFNDLYPPDNLVNPFKYDTIFGRFDGTVEAEAGALCINGQTIRATSERDPANIDWDDVDVVLECTGKFNTTEKSQAHLTGGANRVILSAPAKDEITPMIVMGVNHGIYKPETKIISNASCTTNAMAPIIKILNDAYGIIVGDIITVHAVTASQYGVDVINPKDEGRARSLFSIILTTSGVAIAIGKVIPELYGLLGGYCARVPVPDGSQGSITAMVPGEISIDDVKTTFQEAAANEYAGIIDYTEDKLVLADIIGQDIASTVMGSFIDTKSNQGMTQIRVPALYDNEWGFITQYVDLIAHTADMN